MAVSFDIDIDALEEGNALQGTDEWLKQRLGRFTASQVHLLMKGPRSKAAREAGELAASAESYILEKVAELLTGQSPDIYSNAMQWGNDHEAEAIKMYEKKYYTTVDTATFVEYGDYAGATPDGLIGEEGLIEVKCPFNTVNHIRNILMEDLKSHNSQYYWQIQMQLLVTQRSWCDYVSYDPRVIGGNKMVVHTIKRSENDIELLIKKLTTAVQVLEYKLTQLGYERPA